MLHAAGYYRAGQPTLERTDDAFLYTPDAVAAVDAFRADQGLSTPDRGSPPGLVDAETIDRLWAVVEAAGKGEALRKVIVELTGVCRVSGAACGGGRGAEEGDRGVDWREALRTTENTFLTRRR